MMSDQNAEFSCLFVFFTVCTAVVKCSGKTLSSTGESLVDFYKSDYKQLPSTGKQWYTMITYDYKTSAIKMCSKYAANVIILKQLDIHHHRGFIHCKHSYEYTVDISSIHSCQHSILLNYIPLYLLKLFFKI